MSDYERGYKQGVEDAHRCEQRHAQIDQLEADVRALRAENQRLKEALQGMLQLVDDGLLVRNTANDNMTGWGILALPIVRAVQRANEALQPERGRND